MERLMERFGERGLQKFLYDEEIFLVKSYKTAASFWATKEAFSKAIGTGIGAECSFKDIKIYKTDKGAPKLALSNSLVERFDILNATLSITHDGEYAISIVSVECNSPATDKIEQF